MTAPTTSPKDLVGVWKAEVAFVGGPRRGEREAVVLTLLPDGVIIHRDELPLEDGRLPRGIGEWAAENGRISYRFNVVLADPAGRPAIVVHVHGDGTIGPDRRTFTASGGSEVYSIGGELLATNRAEVRAGRVAPIASSSAQARRPGAVSRVS